MYTQVGGSSSVRLRISREHNWREEREVVKEGGGMALASTSQVGENSACGYAHTRD